MFAGGLLGPPYWLYAGGGGIGGRASRSSSGGVGVLDAVDGLSDREDHEKRSRRKLALRETVSVAPPSPTGFMASGLLPRRRLRDLLTCCLSVVLGSGREKVAV